MKAPPLQMSEGVQLGYALALRAAQDAGVRALAIKGPVLQVQGLRAPKLSVDVDVLIDPSGQAAVLAELARGGWFASPALDTPTLMRRHSATVRHDEWPLELDLHDYFPGFLADPGHVFDVLWSRRTTVEVAHHPVPATDPVASLAVASLHYLRDSTQPARQAQFEEIVDRVGPTWTPSQSEDLLRLATETGSLDTLAPLLDRLGIRAPASPFHGSAELREWWLRSETTTTTASIHWLAGFRRSPWRERPRLALDAVWPSEAEVRRVHPQLPAGRRPVDGARLRRLRYGLRDLPRAVRETRQGRSR